MNWLHYLLEANLYLVVFYAGYQLFLKNETYYTLNRVYLLLSCTLSFVFPLVQIGVLKPAEQDAGVTAYVLSTGLKPVANQAAAFSLSIQDVLFYAYLLGVIVLAIILLLKLFKLASMTRAAHKMIDERYKIVPVDDSNIAFSFFNYLFIGSKTTGNDIIIRHELVHIRQKHTFDVLFLELIKIINWFNPFIYLMQVSLKTVHEYIADEQTAALETDALTYSSFLVNNAYGLNGSSVTHSFFNYNLLKKRIIMLNQKRSGNLARLKYLVTVPICAAALCASTLGFSKTYALIDLVPRHDIILAADYKTANIATDTTRIINKNQVTSKGYKYKEEGYLINGKTDFRVVITEKNGEQVEYFKHSAKPADLAMLKNKYGYSFPKMLIYPKLPPPPPVPVAPSVNAPDPKAITKRPPPPPPVNPVKAPKSALKVKKNTKVIDVVISPPPADEPAPPAPVQTSGEAVPPPPPPKDPFEDLHKYIAKYTRYPTAAHDNHIGGRLIIAFTLNDGKMNNIKITRGVDQQIDAEVLRVLKNFTGSVSIKSGNYAMPISFTLVDKNDKQVAHTPDNYMYKAVAANPDKTAKPTYMLNEVVIVGYMNN
ncbi:M56 family metallopeptidase [Mucilaginibacter pocheonensis]|uniref:Peptidase M56 domain-containing protein n=1 Tax=Mucilaginibacter pocheonensis TaxID=398050 RepID=A0ABU1T7C2_9SPHI|nr:M56 family metallopeptidase [Mucilaginibacter pocheonensis]MDR6941302.1 hypothetical protein [Mucilaginibacter pocheonensis]